MYGFKLKYAKTAILLLAVVVAIFMAWYYLPHPFFIMLAVIAAVLGMITGLARNAWSQSSDDSFRPSQAGVVRPKRDRKSRAAARASRRAEVLHPEATVSLSEERRAADIEEVFTALDNQLVGLVPVKKKVEEIASLLLVDRVRHRFGLEAPRPDAELAFREYLTLRMAQPRFANARSVRNELERARLRYAFRLAAEPELDRSKDDLMRLEEADIMASPLFSLAESMSAVEESARRL